MINVAEIKRQVSPVEVIERYTGARRSHGKYPCPFHADKHPSLSVKADKWHCWACGAGGDVLNFTQKYFGLSFVEASVKLASDFNIEIEAEPTKRDVWAQVEAKCRQKRQQELQQVRENIDSEIEAMTIIHLAMFRAGVPDEVLNRYAQEIDDLERYKEAWR